MGQITTGIGLISGLPIADIVDQLMALEARPKNLIERRNAVLTAQQVAFQTINANLLALKGSAASLTVDSTFDATRAASSNESVLTVTSSNSAVPGNYTFRVQQLVSAQQTITQGFLDTDASLVGAGTLTFEPGGARLDSITQLNDLNGGAGISRGYIRITDRSGASVAIDLSAAVTINDVVDAINSNLNASVTASIDGDNLVITDNTGSTTSNLTIADLGSSTTATSLGIASNVAATSITGTRVNSVGNDTLLSTLNNGNGVRIASGVSDLRVTDGSGAFFDVDLDDSIDIEDVIDAINAAATTAGVSVTAALSSDNVSLELTDAGGGGASFAVTAMNSSGAASDLGILTDDTDLTGVIEGERILAGINSKLLKYLNGGAGVGSTTTATSTLQSLTPIADLLSGAGLTTSGNNLDDIIFIDRTGAQYWMDLDALTTVQNFIDQLSTDSGGALTLTIEGNALRLTDSTGASASNLVGTFAAPSYTAITEMGLQQSVAGTTFLGSDLSPVATTTTSGPGSIRIDNMAGTQTDIDLMTARSVSDIISLINDAGAGVTVAINDAGNGLKITDTSGGSGSLVVSDLTGTPATGLGLAGTFTDTTTDSGNLQLQYITEGTRLENLDVTRGKFIITDSSGQSATVDLTQGNEVTIADVISEINSRGLQLTASINTNGDGILITDTGPGTLAITIEESGSDTAADLGLLGEAASAGANLDGTFDKTVTVEATHTLADVATAINDAGAGVTASIINDGTAGAPYRLSLGADSSGRNGAFVFDDGALDFGAFNLSEAQDAVVFFGGADPGTALAITSQTNSISSVIPGATIDLLTTSDSPVKVTISRDDDTIISGIDGFVRSFNSLMDTFDKFDSYNSETEERGLLLGDSTILSVRQTIYNSVINRNTDLSGQFTSLAQVGITVGSGAQLRLDQAKFRDALEADRDAVEALFTFKEIEEDSDGVLQTISAGVGVRIDELLDRLTDSQFGPIQSRVDGIDQQIALNNDRIEQLDILLAGKRQRLLSQFLAMERALASLQTQSTALGSLQLITLPNRNNNN